MSVAETILQQLGGKRALQSILDAGGFCSFEGMEYVQELAA